MILLLIGVFMGLSALVLVIYPLFGLDQAAGGILHLPPGRDSSAFHPADMGEMSERERAARQALFEVDFDYRLGNLDDEDYTQLRDRYEESALVALKARYERERSLDDVIARQLAALKAEDERQGSAANGRQVVARPVRPAAAARGSAPTVASVSGERRRRRRKGVV